MVRTDTLLFFSSLFWLLCTSSVPWAHLWGLVVLSTGGPILWPHLLSARAPPQGLPPPQVATILCFQCWLHKHSVQGSSRSHELLRLRLRKPLFCLHSSIAGYDVLCWHFSLSGFFILLFLPGLQVVCLPPADRGMGCPLHMAWCFSLCYLYKSHLVLSMYLGSLAGWFVTFLSEFVGILWASETWMPASSQKCRHFQQLFWGVGY